jgi:hypothetical protein
MKAGSGWKCWLKRVVGTSLGVSPDTAAYQCQWRHDKLLASIKKETGPSAMRGMSPLTVEALEHPLGSPGVSLKREQ